MKRTEAGHEAVDTQSLGQRRVSDFLGLWLWELRDEFLELGNLRNTYHVDEF